jgi:hypothetical protein
LELSPNHEKAKEVRGLVARMEESIPALLADLKLPEEEAWEIAILHE